MASSAQSASAKPRPNARMRACLRILEQDYDRVLEIIENSLPKGYELIRTNTVDKTDHRWAYIVGPTYGDNPKDPGFRLNQRKITEWVIPPGWPPHWVVDLVPFALEPVLRRQVPSVDYVGALRVRRTTSPRMLALVGMPADRLDEATRYLLEILPTPYKLVETDVEDKKGQKWFVLAGPTVNTKSKPVPFTWEGLEVTEPVEVGKTPPAWRVALDAKLKLERLPIEDLPDQPFKISNKT